MQSRNLNLLASNRQMICDNPQFPQLRFLTKYNTLLRFFLFLNYVNTLDTLQLIVMSVVFHSPLIYFPVASHQGGLHTGVFWVYKVQKIYLTSEWLSSAETNEHLKMLIIITVSVERYSGLD